LWNGLRKAASDSGSTLARLSDWTRQILQPFGVETFAELAALPLDQVLAKLDDADLHAGDALLAVLVLRSVEDLRKVTSDLQSAARATDSKTGRLVAAAWLTLFVAIVTLAATIVIAITS
jgi:uncharacterized membrane protein